MLQQLLPAEVFAFLLVFARAGAALMLLPGFGEVFVVARVRLAIALLFSLALTPVVAPGLPAAPATPFGLVFLLAAETAIGLFVGGAARLILTSLHVAGSVIAFQTGLGTAQFFDPAQGTQSVLVATLLTLFGLTLIFATDLHLLALRAAADSYVLFPAGAAPSLAGFAEIATDLVAGSFLLGVQIAAPFIVYGLVFYIGLGLLSRLMPQLQVFFIAMPAQILIGMALIGIMLGAGGIWFVDHAEQGLSQFLAPR